MGLVWGWLWYLLAFGLGSAVAWATTVIAVKPTSKDEVLTHLPGSGEIGVQ